MKILKILQVLDPFYWFFRWVLRDFFKAPLKNDEKKFVVANAYKDRKVMWVNVVIALLVFSGIRDMSTSELNMITGVLTSTVMILGVAWFSISFAAIPAKLMKVSMSVTFWLLTGFTSSLTSMFLAVAFTVKPIFWPILVLIYLATIIACTQYDTADGLKAGLDEAQLRLSRAALLFIKEKGGIEPPED